MNKQLSMFTTEDLPLFSGTAPKGSVNPFETYEEPQQATLPIIHCAFCMDTGRVRTSLSPAARRTIAAAQAIPSAGARLVRRPRPR